MTKQQENAARLGRLVRQRRKELKLTQAAVQEEDGPSTATLRLIEGGKHTDFRPSTSEPLERVLEWQRGSIDSILAGGEPTPLAPGTTTQKPARPPGQTITNTGLKDVESLIAAASELLAARDLLLPDTGSSLSPDAQVKLARVLDAQLRAAGPLLVLACEVLGESLAGEDLSEGFPGHLDRYVSQLSRVRDLAHRMFTVSSDDSQLGGFGDFSTRLVTVAEDGPTDAPDHRGQQTR